MRAALEMEEDDSSQTSYDDDDDDEEAIGLVGSIQQRNRTSSHAHAEPKTNRHWKFLACLALVSLILAGSWAPKIRPNTESKADLLTEATVPSAPSSPIVVEEPTGGSTTPPPPPLLPPQKKPDINESPLATPAPQQITPISEPEKPAAPVGLQYTCPVQVNTARNVENSPHEEWYNEVSREIQSNLSHYLANFRQQEFDNWGHSFAEVENGMREWKIKEYRNLRSNSTIYESACGIGLNLYMTLELLHQVYNVTNITVYGNEYVPESVEIARTLAQGLPGQGRRGTLCTADSTQLSSFVPANSFDLVFTGYLSPLLDPLQYNYTKQSDLDRAYTDLCEATTNATEMERNQRAQQVQNDWYAAWVLQMIRIAKPGAKIIVEQVSWPFCQAYFDWGGVARSFWTGGVKRYNWDIDQDSIVMAEDKIFRKRYHVSMRKNKRRRIV